MPHTIIEIRTWSCPECGYKQDFEPTQELMDLHFNSSPTCKLTNCQENECPCCALENMRGKQMGPETDPAKKMRMTVMGEEDIEEEISRILEANEEGIISAKNPDLSTESKKTVYRAARKEDIAAAIIAARVHEDLL